MAQRATQTPEYWGDAFAVTEEDLEQLLNLFMEDELPRTEDELALEIMRRRCQREEAAVSRELAKGKLFQPKQHYEAADHLVFPALDYALGEVTAVRPGSNPDYGSFNVIQVEFDARLGTREFACDLAYPHRLNEELAKIGLEGSSKLRPPEELYASYGNPIRDKLMTALRGSQDFVWLFGKWFPRSLVADVNVGHLNLAEAVLDMAGGGPLPTMALLKDVGLPAEINRHLQEFSLNYAMSRDERFDEVGPTGEVLWFLRRLEPPEALFPPKRLMAEALPYRRDALDETLQRLEHALDDEYSDLPPTEDADEITWVLTYPHRRTGSVPLSARIARLFPTGRTHRIRFTFEDARTGNRWLGWVVREHRFAFGLDTWYEANDVPVGAYIQLRRGDEPGVVVIDWQGRRPKREWVRVVVPRDGLSFEMLKRQVNCEYDELMMMWVDNPAAIDEIAQRLAGPNQTLGDLIRQLFPHLAKLSPQGAVHAKTMYSAINLMRRVAPGPLFAEMMLAPIFRAVGDGYWVLAE